MGLILDSSVAIAAERRKAAVEDLLAEIRAITGPVEIALSAVSVMELEHGIWRAHDATQAERRRQFLEDLIAMVPVYPLTMCWRGKPAGSMRNCKRKASASLSPI